MFLRPLGPSSIAPRGLTLGQCWPTRPLPASDQSQSGPWSTRFIAGRSHSKEPSRTITAAPARASAHANRNQSAVDVGTCLDECETRALARRHYHQEFKRSLQSLHCPRRGRRAPAVMASQRLTVDASVNLQGRNCAAPIETSPNTMSPAAVSIATGALHPPKSPAFHGVRLRHQLRAVPSWQRSNVCSRS